MPEQKPWNAHRWQITEGRAEQLLEEHGVAFNRLPTLSSPSVWRGTCQCPEFIQTQSKFLHEVAWYDTAENMKTLSFNHSWIIEKIF